MIKIFILNGSEYALKLFNNFDLHSYTCKLALPTMFIFKDDKLIHKINNFNNLYDLWLSLF